MREHRLGVLRGQVATLAKSAEILADRPNRISANRQHRLEITNVEGHITITLDNEQPWNTKVPWPHARRPTALLVDHAEAVFGLPTPGPS